MKHFIGKFIAGMTLVLACGFLAGCQDTEDISAQGNQDIASSAEGTIAQDVKGPAEEKKSINLDGESEILLVERSTNYAWGCYDKGLFVDTHGKVYPYDFSRYGSAMDVRDFSLSFVERLEIIRENFDAKSFFDEEVLQEVMELGESISAEDEFKEEEKMYDYGQNTLYFYRPETEELLKLQSTGDVDYTPLNKDAEKIAKLYEKHIDKYYKSFSESDVALLGPYVYSRGEVYMTEFTAESAEQWTGKWLVETKAKLREFAAQSGFDVDGVLANEQDEEYEEFDYFIYVEKAGQTEDAKNPIAFWVYGDCHDFISSDKGSAQEGAYICHIAKIYKDRLFRNPAEMKDLNGTSWKIFD
ncbi:MAG: hypothetical protein J6Z22_06110 [Lachnospiraceae bacterium]|nr:hypothetical protein [Lachnospiraceae bacterium]